MFNCAYAKRHSQRPNLGWMLGDPALPLSPGDWAAMAASQGAAHCFCPVCTCVYVRLSLDAVLPLVAPGCLFSLQGLRPVFPTRGFNPRLFTKAPGCPVLPRSVLRKQRGPPSPMGLLGDWLGGGFQERTIQARTEEAEGPREHPGDSPALCGVGLGTLWKQTCRRRGARRRRFQESDLQFSSLPDAPLGCPWLSRVEGALHTGRHKHVHTHSYTQAPTRQVSCRIKTWSLCLHKPLFWFLRKFPGNHFSVSLLVEAKVFSGYRAKSNGETKLPLLIWTSLWSAPPLGIPVGATPPGCGLHVWERNGPW